MATSSSERDQGSYRDPSGFVFQCDGEIYRAVAASHWPAVIQLIDSGLLDHLTRSGDLVPTTLVSPDDPALERLRQLWPDWQHFLRHDTIENISYPYEWCFSMLADAGLLHLRIQRKLIEKGFSLKDASAFNVQFVRGNPVFIDLLSFARPPRLDIWLAYGQFCRMFLYPLLAYRAGHVTPRQIFLGDLEGMRLDQIYHLIGRRRSLAPAYFLDIFLQYSLDKRARPEKMRELRPQLQAAASDPRPQWLNLARLERKVRTLKQKHRVSGRWRKYQETSSYTEGDKEGKARFIKDFLAAEKPRTVLDLGCNTGFYSLLAAEQGASVVAIDGDHDCIEELYRQTAERKLPILPLVMDISNPSPATGFRNRERRSFIARTSSQCVFALALLHHLLVAARLSLADIRDFLADLTTRHLVIEYIDRTDAMFETLLSLREDLYEDFNLDRFLSVFSDRFRVVTRKQLPGTQRHLFVLEKR